MNAQEIILVMTQVPEESCANQMAQKLIESGLAACVSILAPCRSIYRWQGNIENSTEIPLLIKTEVSNYKAVEKIIQNLHPYELPEIIYLHVDGGLPDYLQWVRDRIQPSGSL